MALIKDLCRYHYSKDAKMRSSWTMVDRCSSTKKKIQKKGPVEIETEIGLMHLEATGHQKS